MVQKSHPSWVCGLKLAYSYFLDQRWNVTPFVGVWIETDCEGQLHGRLGRHTLRGCVD